MKKVIKQKSYSLNLVTKDFFRKELRQELNITIERLLHGIRQEIAFSIETVVDKFEKKLSNHTSLVLTTVDPLLKELETRRQDRELAAEHDRRINKKIYDHDKRIKKLEHIQQSA